MNFELDDTQLPLQKGVMRFLSKELTAEAVREAEASTDGFPAEHWSRITELGWSSVAVPKSHAGSGRGIVDLCVLAREFGRAAATTPLVVSSGLAAHVLGAPGANSYADKLLTSMATSGTVLSAALVEEVGRSERSPAFVLVDDGAAAATSGTIRGKKMLVPFASVADFLLVSVRSSSGAPAIVAVDTKAKGLELTRHRTMGGTPLFAVHFDSVEVDSDAILFSGDAATAVLDMAVDVATVVSMAEAVGLCEGILELCIKHAKIRTQFGREIGSFQAVSHAIADMRIETDAVDLLTMEAAWMLDQGDTATAEIASAKAFANDAITELVAAAQRIHGAIGYSNEYDLQLYTRRARAFCLTYGDTAEETERAAVAYGF